VTGGFFSASSGKACTLVARWRRPPIARLGCYFLADQPLHLIQRANNREPIFYCEDDYAKALKRRVVPLPKGRPSGQKVEARVARAQFGVSRAA